MRLHSQLEEPHINLANVNSKATMSIVIPKHCSIHILDINSDELVGKWDARHISGVILSKVTVKVVELKGGLLVNPIFHFWDKYYVIPTSILGINIVLPLGCN